MQALGRDGQSLYDLIGEAIPHLRVAFGEVPLRWQVQETDEGPVVSITALVPAHTDQDLDAALEAFNEVWWLANCQRSNRQLVFDYEVEA